MSDEIITIADARGAGYCVKGIREWCRAKGIDFRSFVANGIPYKDVAHYNDAMVEHVMKIKRGK